jgi:hypothetical protein
MCARQNSSDFDVAMAIEIDEQVMAIRSTAFERKFKRGVLFCCGELAVSQLTMNTQPRPQRYYTQLRELSGRRN